MCVGIEGIFGDVFKVKFLKEGLVFIEEYGRYSFCWVIVSLICEEWVSCRRYFLISIKDFFNIFVIFEVLRVRNFVMFVIEIILSIVLYVLLVVVIFIEFIDVDGFFLVFLFLYLD